MGLRGASWIGWIVVPLVAIPWGPEVQAQQSELFSCVASGGYCSDTTGDVLAEGCGQTFYQFTGRVAWPPLVNLGPVTIGVRTLANQGTPYPIYVEIRDHTSIDPQGCTTLLAGALVLVAQGSTQCGGEW